LTALAELAGAPKPDTALADPDATDFSPAIRPSLGKTIVFTANSPNPYPAKHRHTFFGKSFAFFVQNPQADESET
jgi:hypothetical protein